ncbi:MAG: class I SAM-dependent methyltransferase [Pirellulales bacterium]
MSLATDLRVLYHLAFKKIRGQTHADRLESFYSGQAADYDSFRKRLLSGREELWRSVPAKSGSVWVDLGGGTGANLEFIADRVPSLGHVYVVDLSPSLLKMARDRVAQHAWTNVSAVEADATLFSPPEGQVDVVTFSYSLTMIPDWYAAIDNAVRILRPGGILAVVDFYVSRKHPPSEWTRHGWSTRSFWPVWFGNDNVHPSPDHVPYLHRAVAVEKFVERRAKVPYLPFVRVPYYQLIGRKRG